MSAPRTKRPFAGAASDPAQRQITSFFSAADPAAPVSVASPSSRPTLPADTQSNLLNVGMRVRKSVPEGYKTGSYTAMGLFSDLDQTSKDIKNSSSQSSSTMSSTVASRQPSSYNNSSCQRELLPFCGINKVGGLSTQPSFTFDSPSPPSSHGYQMSGIPGIDDVPSLSSSQGSIKSNSSAMLSVDIGRSTANNRKRVYSDGEESDAPSVSDCLQVPSGEWMDGQVSPRSLVPAGWENTRVMAVPRKMRQQQLKTASGSPVVTSNKKARGGLDQENMVVDEDFSEADFLDCRALDDEDVMHF